MHKNKKQICAWKKIIISRLELLGGKEYGEEDVSHGYTNEQNKEEFRSKMPMKNFVFVSICSFFFLNMKVIAFVVNNR